MRFSPKLSGPILILPALLLTILFPALLPAEFVAIPESSNVLNVMEDSETFMEISFQGWGPAWQWLGFRGPLVSKDGQVQMRPAATIRASNAELAFDVTARQSSPRQLQLQIQLSTDRDTELTSAIVSVDFPSAAFAQGQLALTDSEDQQATVAMPLGRQGLGDAIRQIAAVDTTGRRTVFSLQPACQLASDSQLRIVMAEQQLRVDSPRRLAVTIDLPGDLTFFPDRDNIPNDTDADRWYTFQPSTDDTRPSELDMSDWLDAPAGRRGRILRQDDQLLYDGAPIKLWGLNVCYSTCAPDKELADRRADFYAKHGINTVRLHKYADGTGWAGIQAPDSFVEFDAEALDRMDYFVAALKRRGIYVLLSSTFGVKLGPKDRQYVPYMDEFGTGGNRVSTGHGSVFLARELQDLQIQQIVKLLRHKNPYTGQNYADDPAVAVVELFNEDSALFFGTLSQLQKIPTLRRRAAAGFCDWLEKRYGGKDGLLKAWGADAINSFGNEGFSNESWEDRSIVPAGNPWFYDPDQLAGSQAVKRQRMHDTMLFLYEIQNEFYGRYVQAIRDAGYAGEILASNWQAGRAFSHYYNLHSDYLVGTIDRHNYFGGGSGAKIDNASMLRTPGSAMLSAGMQQVADRPFMLSEWIHVSPTEWGAEGPAIIGAYGMGLQGWDVSYMFQNRDTGGFANEINRDRWEVTSPQVMGVFPAVSRQVLRGDVSQSDVTAPRYVHLPSLVQGKLDFDDRVTQAHDVKTFTSDKVPAESLAVARCVVDFTDELRATPVFDLDKYRQGDSLCSSTGQLRWTPGETKLDGYFTIDSQATKAIVGFANGQTCELGDVTISPQSEFSAIYVTAQGKAETLATSRRLLIVAIARARNTGMRVFDGSRLLDKGTSPVVMEPVQATIQINKPGRPTIHLLDHDGCRTGKTLPVVNGKIEIDGSRDQTPYYLIEY